MHKDKIVTFAALGTGTVPDGYFGHRVAVRFFYDPQSHRIMLETGGGYYPSLLDTVKDEREARSQLLHHPLAKKYYTYDEEKSFSVLMHETTQLAWDILDRGVPKQIDDAVKERLFAWADGLTQEWVMRRIDGRCSLKALEESSLEQLEARVQRDHDLFIGVLK